MTYIELSVEDEVAHLVLNRPEKKNAIGTPMWKALEDALDAVNKDAGVRVLVLRAAGEDFCVGADLAPQVPTGESVGPSHGTQLERMQWINSIVTSLHSLKIPTIARVDGLAVGIGMNLALCCDFIVASDRARFSEIFIRRALTVDGGGSWMLPRLVGIRQAKRLCMLGEMISADEALDLGLITTVTDISTLDSTVDKLVGTLRGYSRTALTQMKTLLDESHDVTFEHSLENEARVQSLNVAGDDFKSAVAEFTRKTYASANPRKDSDG
ncbi:2-(1,2-epoxy-1,2-dihydrophenyl)acetyl-CoA isomerase [Rhodococcus erythropolis]|uniref:enoyl-CoA hydratase/isomerase family protein n=1 Tax=Rhodococcus erythropolis TaxID=1833 RepID=UPI00216A3903|nr:enoyl-CoA hydratase-related protein [Rhodococcus erythropolis]MCS4256000.1 2-(1,2-epoxy-1,2-dihydrophenyl)acetyl-CoA isomerase [Rhodococcus erythropolis]MCW2425516.1 2-(1,2-epoxy-1,2-dihydrophenyl)acetyl-CoA isomerase [Rhodococcus erythropolis]